MEETNPKGRRDIILVMAASFSYMACPMLVMPLVVGFSESLGANAAVMGLVGGLMNLCSLFCRPLVGNLADRFSKYAVTMLGNGFLLAACLGYLLAKSPALVLASRVLHGVGFSCCSVALSTWVANLLPKNKVGSGMGLYGTMNALSMAVGPAIGVRVYQRLGYRAAFAVALCFSLALLILIQFVRDRGKPLRADRPLAIQLVDLQVAPISLVIMLFAIPYCATQSFLVRYTETLTLPVAVSLFFPFYAVVLMALRLSLKGFFDKIPFRFFLFACCISSLLSLLLLARMQSNAAMLAAAVCMAGGFGLMSSVCQSTAFLMASENRRGLANSTYYVGLDLGLALGPMLGGLLYGGVPTQMFYPILTATIPLILVVYLAFRRRLRQL